ncbi:MAG: helix-turn-helix domain-containing protein [Planctomycetales bacterium]|nr:helix-turn-helix domain-containing protein [Planctomycetales bacterium]
MVKPKQITADVLLIDYQAICRMLGIGSNHFFGMRQTGRFPIKSIRLGRSVRYNRRQVEAWIEAGCPVDWRER